LFVSIPDHISRYYLKVFVTDNKYITNFINITNTCINLGFWPLYFKKLTLIIIPKLNKLACNSQKMFHLILLLNILRKLIEKVISKRIQFHSIANNFIHPNQHQLGGLKQCSTINAGLYLTHLIHIRWVKELHISTLTFNIVQFFSLLNHQLLPMIFNLILKFLCSLII